jgi:SAM-dependent MidA family methyltransferase
MSQRVADFPDTPFEKREIRSQATIPPTDDSSLSQRLRERIKREGPISFRDWMEAALYDPQEGYYCRPNRERWGRNGDYRTSAEKSILFAATFARHFARLYEELGSPAEWSIVESGAGVGQFAAILLETLQARFPRNFSATRYFLDEISTDSCAQARERLAKFGSKMEIGRFADLDLQQGILFSNELIDAFPIHRVTLRDGKLSEFFVDVNESEDFEWVTGPLSTLRLVDYFERFGIQLAEGQIAEVNLEVEDWLRSASRRLQNGYLVTVDYGAEASELFGSPAAREGRLRGYNRHQFVDNVLAKPGEYDITTTIDWTFLKEISEDLGFQIIEFERQDRFLLKAGLLEELEQRVNEAKDEAEKLRLSTSTREMILPGGMAASFHVLVLQKR